jgi:hypothetical protein
VIIEEEDHDKEGVNENIEEMPNYFYQQFNKHSYN